jgi:transcriptional regulator with XRE-family HTH domain
MDAWPQREIFRACLKAYQENSGKSQEDVAGELGVARSSLRFWLYQQKRKPSFEVLKRAAKLFGCSVTEFVDDPAGAARVPGVAQDAWAALSERDKVIGIAVFHDITADDLTEEDKDMLFAAWKEEVAKLKRYKQAAKGQEKPHSADGQNRN